MLACLHYKDFCTPGGGGGALPVGFSEEASEPPEAAEPTALREGGGEGQV